MDEEAKIEEGEAESAPEDSSDSDSEQELLGPFDVHEPGDELLLGKQVYESSSNFGQSTSVSLTLPGGRRR